MAGGTRRGLFGELRKTADVIVVGGGGEGSIDEEATGIVAEASGLGVVSAQMEGGGLRLRGRPLA